MRVKNTFSGWAVTRPGDAAPAVAGERRVRKTRVQRGCFCSDTSSNPPTRPAPTEAEVVGSGESRERCVVNVQFRVAPDHLPGAPLAVVRIERMERGHAVVRGVFARQHPAAGNFPGRVLQIRQGGAVR